MSVLAEKQWKSQAGGGCLTSMTIRESLPLWSQPNWFLNKRWWWHRAPANMSPPTTEPEDLCYCGLNCLYPQDCTGEMVFKEVVMVKLGHMVAGGGIQCNRGLCEKGRGTRKDWEETMWTHSEWAAICRPKWRTEKKSTCWHLDSDFWPQELWKDNYLSQKPLTCVTLLEQSELIHAVSKPFSSP